MSDNTPSIQAVMLPIDQLERNAWNPNTMTDEQLAELDVEVRRLGRVPKPIIVRRKADKFEVIDGAHSLKAAQQAGHTEVQCEIHDIDDFESMRQTYKRNRGGTDNPLALGLMFRAMMEDRGLSQRALAKEIGVSDHTIGNHIAYVTAAELRNSFAAIIASIPSPVDLSGPTECLIAQLSNRQVSAYLELPEEIRDTWLDAGAPLPAVKSLLAKQRRGTSDMLAKIIQTGLYRALSIFPDQFASSLRRASDYAEWLRSNAYASGLEEFAIAAASFGLTVRVMGQLPLGTSGHDVRVLISLEAWEDILRRCYVLEFSRQDQPGAVGGQVAEELNRSGVDLDSVLDISVAPKVGVVRDAPEHVRDAEFLTFDEKHWLASRLADSPNDEVMNEVVMQTCEDVRSCRDAGVSDEVSAIFRRALVQHKKQQAIADAEEFLRADDARQSLVDAFAETESLHSATIDSRPAVDVLAERIFALPAPEFALIVGTFNTKHADQGAAVWLKAIRDELPQDETPDAVRDVQDEQPVQA